MDWGKGKGGSGNFKLCVPSNLFETLILRIPATLTVPIAPNLPPMVGWGRAVQRRRKLAVRERDVGCADGDLDGGQGVR